MFRPEINTIVEEITEQKISDPHSLPYITMFKLIGVNPDLAFTVIPFLNRDTHYLSIPGRKARINNFEGNLESLTTSSEIERETARYQTTLPQIPLIPLDLRLGIPSTFRHQFGKVDLFIVNHGIILSGLDTLNPNAAITYLSSIGNATRPGSLLMVIDSVYESQFRPDQIAQIIGATPLQDSIDLSTNFNLGRAGLRPRSLSRAHLDGQNHLGDYINLPESHENDRLYFFTKN